MKVYIQSYSNHIPRNYNIFNAYEGFLDMGAEVVHFCNPQELVDSTKDDIVVGYVNTVRQRLYELGFSTPDIDYPVELTKYLGRKIWKSTINCISNSPNLWPVFVKSTEDKRITGKVISSIHDLVGCGESGCDAEVYCCEPIKFIAEWRLFLRYGEILDIRPYKGDWHSHYDCSVIESCIKDYTSAPKGCSVDFGVTADGRTLLIEVNDGYSLACYGLNKYDYSKLLSARWSELTNTIDPYNFYV